MFSFDPIIKAIDGVIVELARANDLTEESIRLHREWIQSPCPDHAREALGNDESEGKMKFGQQIATSKEAGGEVSGDVLEFLGQVETPGINFACRSRQFGPVSVWVYVGKSEKLLRHLDDVVAQAIKNWVATAHPGEQTAVRKPDGSHEIDRQDGLGSVPFSLATQPYCADCDSPCELGECDPPHLCRKHSECAVCNTR